MDVAFLWDTLGQLLAGLPLTVELAAASIAAGGLLAGLITAVAAGGRFPAALARAYVFVFRGSPLLVQIFLIYYGIGQFRPALQAWGLWTLFREPWFCAVLALSLNTAAYCSEIFRGGLQAVPAQQVEAARACGMAGLRLFRRIVFPIALRQALPAYGNEVILMVKATSLASVITMIEVTGVAGRIISETFRAVEVFLVAGAIYLALNFLITRAVLLAERRLTPHLRARPSSPAIMGKVHA